MLDNLRRTLSAPCYVSGVDCRVADAWIVSVDVDAVHSGGNFTSCALAFSGGTECSPGRNLEAKSHSRSALRPFAGSLPSRADDYISRLPGMADVRRNTADVGPLIHNPSEPPGMGNGGAGKAESGSGDSRDLSADGGNRGPRRYCAWGCSISAPPGFVCRSALCRLVACSSGGSAMDQPPAEVGRRGATAAGRHSIASVHVTPNVALLRKLRFGNRSLASTGQFSGGPKARRRAPHVAHEYRAVPALDTRSA